MDSCGHGYRWSFPCPPSGPEMEGEAWRVSLRCGQRLGAGGEQGAAGGRAAAGGGVSIVLCRERDW